MTDNAIRLGIMPPLTGIVGMYGAEIRRAAEIACGEVNEAGGVLDRPLELVIADDGSLPESAVVAANRLVQEHQCAALVGNLLSNARIAVAYRVAEPLRIPYLNFSFHEGAIVSRYFFHFAALPNQQIDRMIPVMGARHGPRMFFAGHRYEWPRGSIAAARQALDRIGGTMVGEEYFPMGMDPATIDRLLTAVDAARPDVFVPYFAGADQIRLLTRFTERGLKARIAVVMGHYDEVMASHLTAEVREGFYSSNTYFMSIDTPENRAFLDRLAAWPGVSGLWPPGDGMATNFGEGAYLCVKAFAHAANQAGAIDPEILVDALAHVRVTGPQGPVRMDPDSHHAEVNTWLARCQADGRFAIVEKFGAIPPVLPERYRHQRLGAHPADEDEVRLQSRILEHLSEAVLLVQADHGAVVYANQSAADMLGHDRAALAGMAVAALMADNAPVTADAVLEAVTAKGAWAGETRFTRGNGAQAWCDTRVSVFTHPSHGEVALWVLKDITDLRRLQHQLASSERRFRATFEQAAVGIAHVAPDGTWLRVNNRLCDIVGWDRESLLARTFQDITHPDDMDAGLDLLRRTLAGEIDHFTTEKRYFRQDGTVVWINLTVALVRDSAGRPDYFISVIEDIGPRKAMEARLRKSEAKFASIFFSAGMLMSVSRIEDGTYEEVNETFIKASGYNREETIGTTSTALGFISPESRNQLVARLVTDGQVRDLELALTRRDGSTMYCLYNGEIIEIGGEKKLLSVAQDITRQKEVEEDLRRTVETLTNMNAELERFSYISAHDLREPLRILTLYSQLLARSHGDCLDADGHQYLSFIVDAARRMLNLIRDFQAYSRLSTETHAFAPVDANHLVAETLGLLEGSIRENGARIETGPLPTVRGDRTQLLELFKHLIANALKFRHPQLPPEITISTIRAGDSWTVAIADNGIGIEPRYAQDIFQIFKRLHGPTVYPGTGIGLAICKRIVERHGGQIWVDSTPDRGSTFRFTLPAAE